jgi:hypothetical protein
MNTSTLSKSSFCGSDNFKTLAMLVVVAVANVRGATTRGAIATREARGAKAEAVLMLAINMVVNTALAAVNFMVEMDCRQREWSCEQTKSEWFRRLIVAWYRRITYNRRGWRMWWMTKN